ncbi:MAG TPA: presqualene diphosphate synthase HpnD [Caulobacteraceae bacterium]|nr:presqualene diphosphate synthase HpnD [Caulobacteraceae bacterium]
MSEVIGAPDMKALEAKVSGSSFYAAMKMMPANKRAAMFAIYAFCREVDDIADDLHGDRAGRAAALDGWRADLAALYGGGPAGRAAFLIEAVEGFGLKQDDFLAVIDGMAMDVDGDIIAPDRMTLDLYCDRVASAVGRLSVKVFGMQDKPGVDLSHHLGRALQLTNILRDLDEDAAIGRLYLSKEALTAAGIEATDPLVVVSDPRIDMAAQVIAATARVHYDAADRIMKDAKVGDMRAPRLMRVAYGRILERMQAKGWAPPRRRVSLSKLEKLWVALRYGLLA